jgi:hypothetical protein
MAMRPAIAEHGLGSVVCGSLDGKLQSHHRLPKRPGHGGTAQKLQQCARELQ